MDSPLPGWSGLAPRAFARQHGDPPGVDHDFGGGWGPHHDQRVSLRHPAGSRRGLLYAYDGLWDEYAVLAPDVSLAQAHTAYVQALEANRHMPVEDFADLVAHAGQTAALQPASNVQPVPHAGMEL